MPNHGRVQLATDMDTSWRIYSQWFWSILMTVNILLSFAFGKLRHLYVGLTSDLQLTVSVAECSGLMNVLYADTHRHVSLLELLCKSPCMASHMSMLLLPSTASLNVNGLKMNYILLCKVWTHIYRKFTDSVHFPHFVSVNGNQLQTESVSAWTVWRSWPEWTSPCPQHSHGRVADTVHCQPVTVLKSHYPRFIMHDHTLSRSI